MVTRFLLTEMLMELRDHQFMKVISIMCLGEIMKMNSLRAIIEGEGEEASFVANNTSSTNFPFWVLFCFV